MKKYLLLFSLLAGVFFISCSGDDDGEGKPGFAVQGTLKVGNQIYQNGTITVDYIHLNHDGWVAIYRYTDRREELLGYSFLQAGTHQDVIVELEEFVAVENVRLLALLHLDVNENELFDWDGQTGNDLPLKRWDVEVARQFSIYMRSDFVNFWITVEDQTLATGPFWDSLNVLEIDLELIKELLKSNTAWVVAYNWGVDGPNEIIGGSDVLEVKRHEQVNIWMWGRVQPGDVIWLVLHDDMGERGVFEELDDMVWDPEREAFLMTPVRIKF